jgi:hypothetical protein
MRSHFLRTIPTVSAPPSTDLTITPVGSLGILANTGSSQSMGNFTIPRAGLFVVVATVSGGGMATNMSSITLGGTAMSLVVNNTSTTDYTKSSIRALVVSAGTYNCTMTLTGSNGSSGFWSCSGFLIENYTSTTAFSTLAPARGTVTSTYAANLSAPAGKSVAVYGVLAGEGNVYTVDWSGATEVYESTTGGSFNSAHSYAYRTRDATAGTLSETISVNRSSNAFAPVAALFY